MKVLVTGGRGYSDAALVYRTLDALLPIDCLAEGGATGADDLASRWCKSRRVTRQTFFALWDKQGPVAGPLRNGRMLSEFRPDLVVAFPGATGTADMVRKARAAGVKVLLAGGPDAEKA